MTKKHLKALAQAFANSRPSGDSDEALAAAEQWRRDVNAVSSVCCEMSKRILVTGPQGPIGELDYWRFVDACEHWKAK